MYVVKKKKKDWHSCFFSYSSCPSCYPSNYPEAVPSSCWPLTLSSPKPSHSFPLILTSTSMHCLFLFSCFVSAKQYFPILSFLVMWWYLVLYFLHIILLFVYSALPSLSSPSGRVHDVARQRVRWRADHRLHQPAGAGWKAVLAGPWDSTGTSTTTCCLAQQVPGCRGQHCTLYTTNHTWVCRDNGAHWLSK